MLSPGSWVCGPRTYTLSIRNTFSILVFFLLCSFFWNSFFRYALKCFRYPLLFWFRREKSICQPPSLAETWQPWCGWSRTRFSRLLHFPLGLLLLSVVAVAVAVEVARSSPNESGWKKWLGQVDLPLTGIRQKASMNLGSSCLQKPKTPRHVRLTYILFFLFSSSARNFSRFSNLETLHISFAYAFIWEFMVRQVAG